MAYKAEYIWIDGTKPTAKLRSKTKIVDDDVKPSDLPIWGFDGSSTNQAGGDKSDCVLEPVFTCPDPVRGGDHVLALCEVLNVDMTPHPSNVMPSSRAVSSSAGVMAKLFSVPRTSVNQRRTNRTPRSSTVRRT